MYIYTYIYVCIYIYIYMCVCKFLCRIVCAVACNGVCVLDICACVRMRVYSRACECVHAHVWV